MLDKRLLGGTASAKQTAKGKPNDLGFHWWRFLPVATTLVTLLLIAAYENGDDEKDLDGNEASTDPGTDIL